MNIIKLIIALPAFALCLVGCAKRDVEPISETAMTLEPQKSDIVSSSINIDSLSDSEILSLAKSLGQFHNDAITDIEDNNDIISASSGELDMLFLEYLNAAFENNISQPTSRSEMLNDYDISADIEGFRADLPTTEQYYFDSIISVIVTHSDTSTIRTSFNHIEDDIINSSLSKRSKFWLLSVIEIGYNSQRLWMAHSDENSQSQMNQLNGNHLQWLGTNSPQNPLVGASLNSRIDVYSMVDMYFFVVTLEGLERDAPWLSDKVRIQMAIYDGFTSSYYYFNGCHCTP